MNLASQLKKNFVFISTISIFDKIVSFILVVVIARYLGAAIYGKYAFAVAFISFFVLLSDFGITSLITRNVSKDFKSSNYYLSYSFSFKILASICSLGLLSLLIMLIKPLQENSSILFLVAIALLIRGITSVFFAIIRAHRKLQYEAIAGFINRIITASIGISILILSKNINYFLIVFLLACLIELVFVFNIIKRITSFQFRFDLKVFKTLVVFAFPFMVNGGMSIINYRVDSLIINFEHGSVATGIYNAAYTIVLSLIIIQEIVGRIFLPLFSNLERKDQGFFVRSFIQVFKLILILALLIGLIGSFFSNEIIGTIYGTGFETSANCLRILIWSLFFMFGGYVLTITLIAKNEEKAVLKARILTALLNILLNLILIPQYSFIGASIATIVSEAFFFMFCYYYLVECIRLPIFDIRTWFKLTFALSVSLVFLFTLNEISVFILVPIVTVMFLGILLLVRFVSKEEMYILAKVVSS